MSHHAHMIGAGIGIWPPQGEVGGMAPRPQKVR